MSQTDGPNLIVIGAGKAGTTSLHDLLNRHPDIASPKTKELTFFSNDKRYEQGISSYLAHFTGLERYRVRFETTPQYSACTEFPETARRIHDFYPGMKILYIVRHPLERIVSHFRHWSVTFPERYQDINRDIRQRYAYKPLIDRSRYRMQVDHYRQFFPDSQIEVVFLEDLRTNSTDVLKSIFEFLGVSSEVGHLTFRKINTASSREKAKGISAIDEERFRLSDETRDWIREELVLETRLFLEEWGKAPDFWKL